MCSKHSNCWYHSCLYFRFLSVTFPVIVGFVISHFFYSPDINKLLVFLNKICLTFPSNSVYDQHLVTIRSYELQFILSKFIPFLVPE